MTARLHARLARATGAAITGATLALGVAGCNKPFAVENSEGTRPAPPARAQAQSSRNDRAQDRINAANEARGRGDLDSALAEFERAIAINPELTVAYIGMGDIYRGREQYEQAEQSYGAAAKLEPANFDAQFLHGLVLQLMNRVEDSVRAYLRALAVRPDDFEANLNIGTAYLQLGEADQALGYSQRAVRLNPDSGPARVNLGAVYAALDRHEAAIVEFQQAAELMPEPDPKLLLNLADSLGRVGRHAEVVSTIDQLVRLQPSAVAYERLGSALFRLREYDAAMTAFGAALDMEPNHYPALNGVAVCRLNQYVWSGKADTQSLNIAISALRRSLQIERRQPAIIELLRRYGGAAGTDAATRAGG
jgi:tetratricopeptide (TPR) repeat protein